MSRSSRAQSAHQSTPQAISNQRSARRGQLEPTAHIHEVLSAVREHCRRQPGMEPPDLERLADLLLRVFGADPEYPVRAELEHRTVELHSLDDRHDPVARAAYRRPAPPEDTPPSLQALIARILTAGDLSSVRQREVARLHLWGYTLPEVAELLGVRISVVRTRWRSARRNLRRALSDLAREELLGESPASAAIRHEQVVETFRAEQQPPLYEPPRHCPTGRERCVRTGVCCKVPGGDLWR